jgi:hypothetical protein
VQSSGDVLGRSRPGGEFIDRRNRMNGLHFPTFSANQLPYFDYTLARVVPLLRRRRAIVDQLDLVFAIVPRVPIVVI